MKKIVGRNTSTGGRFTIETNFDAKKLRKGIEKILKDTVQEIGEYSLTKVKHAVNQAKSPPPSKPGNPPHNRTGSLLRSLRSRYVRAQYAGAGNRLIVYTFGTNAKYARPLEYGANLPGGQPFWKDKDGNLHFARKTAKNMKRMAKTKPSRLEPRPFFENTITDAAHSTEVKARIVRAQTAIRREIATRIRPISYKRGR